VSGILADAPKTLQSAIHRSSSGRTSFKANNHSCEKARVLKFFEFSNKITYDADV